MKKSLMLLVATALVAVMTGCGGGSSSAHKKSAAQPVDTTTTTGEQTFNTTPEDTSANVTYKSTATGSFPPAPPLTSLSEAQTAANEKL